MNLTIKPAILILLLMLLSTPSFGQYKMYSTSSTEPINNCFCYYSSQLTGLLYNIDLAQTAAQLVLELWLREQESLMKNEIERRLNTTFGSYGAAQKEFFKQRFGDMEAPQWITQWRNNINNSQDRVREKMNSQFKRHQFFELRRNDLTRIRNGQSALYNFGDLKYGDTKIEDLPSGIIGNLSSTNKEFYDDNMIAYGGYLHREKQLDKVNAEDKLAYAIADRFISHYKNHNQIDKVILMSGYLIADNSNINPTGLGGGVTYYNYRAVDWYDQLSQLVDNTNGVPYPTVSDPNYDARELMAEYAINEMRSLHAKNYLLPRNQLKQGLEDYYYFNRYKQNALDFAERFFNQYATGGIYYPDWEVYRSNSLGYQTEDRPEYIFAMAVPSDGKEEGLDAFSYVLNELSAQGERLDHEGTMMRTMMAANGYWVPSSISDEELGKVFDFDGGRQYIKIEFSSEARRRIDRLHDPNGNYGKSLFTDPFKIEAVKALAASGNADFYDKLIIDQSVPPCVKEIINELKQKDKHVTMVPDILNSEGARHLSEIILDIFDNSSKYMLKFQVSEAGANSNGVPRNAKTLRESDGSGGFVMTITIDDDYVKNATMLSLARTIIHESLHAYLGYVLQNNYTSDIALLLHTYYSEYGNKNIAEHTFMSQYVEAIGYSLAAWDIHKQRQEYYNNLAWSGGMLSTDAYTKLPNSKKAAIMSINKAEGDAVNKATSSAKGVKCK